MKQKNKLVLFIFIMVSSFYLVSMPYKNSLAEQRQLNFERRTHYDIYYQVEDHMEYITNVKIIDTVTMGAATFLEIQSSSLPTENAGYISTSNIIAILPVGFPKPQIYN
ncbi:MAG: hypothetical protein H8D39_00190 [Candidatus Atribacteria bacterium]|nr:hypothetical protein [Candidatus Atribacteria bacterium]